MQHSSSGVGRNELLSRCFKGGFLFARLIETQTMQRQVTIAAMPSIFLIQGFVNHISVRIAGIKTSMPLHSHCEHACASNFFSCPIRIHNEWMTLSLSKVLEVPIRIGDDHTMATKYRRHPCE